jgi:hypothetical protein
MPSQEPEFVGDDRFVLGAVPPGRMRLFRGYRQ